MCRVFLFPILPISIWLSKEAASRAPPNGYKRLERRAKAEFRGLMQRTMAAAPLTALHPSSFEWKFLGQS